MNESMEGAVGLSKGRRTAFSVLAAVFAVVFGVGLFGWLGLVAGWFSSDEGGIHRVHDIGGSGVTTGIFVAGGLTVLAWRRDDVALLHAISMSGLAFALAAVFASDWGSLAFLPIVAVPVVALLAVGGGWRRFAAAGDGFAPATFVVTLATAVPWVIYALAMAKLQRTGSPSDPHVEMHHWTSMAGMALTIVLLGFLASLRTRGWRIVAWIAGLGAAVFGLASVVFADFEGTGIPYPGGEGVGWGLLAIAGGALLVVAAEFDARRGGVA